MQKSPAKLNLFLEAGIDCPFLGIGILAIFLSVLGTRFYKRRFQSEDEISHVQKIILDRINDLEKNQEKLQKDLRDLIEKLKDN